LEPVDVTLEITPRTRFDVLELRSRFPSEHQDLLAPYRHCLYWSAHTTAGFLDRSLILRLTAAHLPSYVGALRQIFPAGAGYAHDRLEQRGDLDVSQRAVEPRNADSHLAFMAGGLRPCVTHPNQAGETVCFLDLDGVCDGRWRRRQARVIGFNRERVVRRARVAVPVSSHPIDSINLKDPKLGIHAHLCAMVADAGVARGRVRIALDPFERHAALTVNEFETLLMKHDLAAVLRNPLRFMAEGYRHALADPLAVPGKALGYAQHDLVRVLNSGLDSLGLQGSIVERAVVRALAAPAARFFRMQRAISLLVGRTVGGRCSLVEGAYQSPILVQWRESQTRTRQLDVTVTELE
jgi:hypothetical protein